MTNGAAETEPLYASVDGVAYPLGREECVFQVRGGHGTHVMTPEVLAALDATRAFRTLAQHAESIAARIPALSGRQDAIRRVLDNLVKRGLLQGDREYLRSASGEQPAPFAGVFVRAGEDGAALSRLLASLRQVDGFDPRAHRWLVISEARDAAASRAHRDAASSFARDTGARVELVDEVRRARIAQALGKAAGAAPPERAIAGTNLALLLGAGRRMSLLEGHALLPLRTQSQETRALGLGDAAHAETRLHADAESALAAGEPRAGDPFAQQLAWCGRRVGSLVAGGELELGHAALAGFEPSRHAALSGASRVLATGNGERGPPIEPSALFLLDGAARDALCAERSRYLALLDGAYVSSAAAQPTLRSYGTSLPFVLDGSLLLPPFAAPGAGGALLFGVLASALHPGSVVLEAQTTLGRDRGAPAPRMRGFQPETPPFAQYLADALFAQLDRVRAEHPEARLRTVAAIVDDLADAPAALRVELLHEYLRFRRSELIDRLQRAFAAFPGAPVYWQADVRELIGVNGRALSELAPPRLAHWPEALDEAGCAERLSRELRDAAALLRAWSALWRAALEAGEGLLAA